MGLHNLQDTIGFQLELKAREILNETDMEIVGNSFYAAGRITSGTFVEVMFYLLRMKNGLEETYSDFAIKCQPLFGKPLTMEKSLQITELFDEFLGLLENV